MSLIGRTNLTEESFFFVTTTVVDFVNVLKTQNAATYSYQISNIIKRDIILIFLLML